MEGTKQSLYLALPDGSYKWVSVVTFCSNTTYKYGFLRGSSFYSSCIAQVTLYSEEQAINLISPIKGEFEFSGSDNKSSRLMMNQPQSSPKFSMRMLSSADNEAAMPLLFPVISSCKFNLEYASEIKLLVHFRDGVDHVYHPKGEGRLMIIEKKFDEEETARAYFRMFSKINYDKSVISISLEEESSVSRKNTGKGGKGTKGKGKALKSLSFDSL